MAKAIEEEEERLTSLPKAVVVGVGAEDGLGAALSRCYAANGHHVLVAGRTLEKVEKVAAAIRLGGGRATAHAVDATREEDVIGLFDAAMADDEMGGPADLVTHNVGINQKIDFRQTKASTLEDFWRQNTLSGFLVGREAARRFAPLGRGSVFFTGASGSPPRNAGLCPLRRKQGRAEDDRAEHGARVRTARHPRCPRRRRWRRRW